MNKLVSPIIPLTMATLVGGASAFGFINLHSHDDPHTHVGGYLPFDLGRSHIVAVTSGEAFQKDLPIYTSHNKR